MVAFRALLVLIVQMCLMLVVDGIPLEYCNLTSRTTLEPKLLGMLSPLIGKQFGTEDDEYSFALTICGQLSTKPGAGVTQKSKKDGTVWSLGSLSDTDVMYGDEWVALTYMSGDAYQNACDRQQRQVHVMIMCDPSAKDGALHFTHEEARTNKTSDCSYLFELDHVSLCSSDLTVTCSSYSIAGMSVGTVLVIIFFSVASAYLLFGMAYRGMVVGATGFELLPNYEFWRKFGELQADGCDFVCRTGNLNFMPLSVSADEPHVATSSRSTTVTQQPSSTTTRGGSSAVSKQYRGQAPRGAYETDGERDANILPM